MNRGDAEDAEKAITACFRDQPVASNPYLPTIQLRLFMDSGLFWSAPAKRRGRIEPQRWGIGTWTPASTRAAATALSPHRKALVWDR